MRYGIHKHLSHRCAEVRHEYLRHRGYGREYVFHSLRHSFSTALLQADVRGVTVDFLMGHLTGKLAVDRYSDGISFQQREEAIRKIKYDVTDRDLTEA